MSYPKMGHKISTVHGVKSENYYEPGNAINEIWLGDIELLSRLPFGDSDLAQAAWPVGGWPKIPWHNFIIPWKRSVDTLEPADGVRQKEGGEMKGTGRFGWTLSHTALLAITAVALPLVVLVAFYLPLRLRTTTPRFRGLSRIDECSGNLAKTRTRGYAIRAEMATVSLLLGLAGTALGFYAARWVGKGLDGPLVIVLDILWALAAAVGFLCSASAVWSLWKDWWMVRKWVMPEESECGSPSSLLDEQLPMDVVEWLERQRRS